MPLSNALFRVIEREKTHRIFVWEEREREREREKESTREYESVLTTIASHFNPAIKAKFRNVISGF